MRHTPTAAIEVEIRPRRAITDSEGRVAERVAAWLRALRERRVERRVATAGTEGSEGEGEALVVLLRVGVQRTRVRV